MPHLNEILSEQIEQLVRKHIESTRQAAVAAVERALSTAAPQAKSGRAAPRTQRPRRTPAELAALGERLYEAVCAQPGETMAVLAPTLGETSLHLHRSMTALKQANRIRGVGERHQRRYFPAVARPPVSEE